MIYAHVPGALDEEGVDEVIFFVIDLGREEEKAAGREGGREGG